MEKGRASQSPPNVSLEFIGPSQYTVFQKTVCSKDLCNLDSMPGAVKFEVRCLISATATWRNFRKLLSRKHDGDKTS